MHLRASSGALILILSAILSTACSSPTEPSPTFADFVVEVEGERFVVRTSDPDTIRAAEENRQGRSGAFPAGVLKRGDGGFNAPWTWHLDPASVRFVEAAIEVCDGRPSYVESHQSEFERYCPWGAKVVARR